MKQINRKYSCVTCVDPGDNTITSSHLHRYWPFSTEYRLRTHSEVLRNIKIATESGNSVSLILRRKNNTNSASICIILTQV